MFILHSYQFKPKSYLKLNKKYVFSEGEQFPLRLKQTLFAARKSHARAYSNTLTHARTNRTHLPHETDAGGIIMYLNRLSHAIS